MTTHLYLCGQTETGSLRIYVPASDAAIVIAPLITTRAIRILYTQVGDVPRRCSKAHALFYSREKEAPRVNSSSLIPPHCRRERLVDTSSASPTVQCSSEVKKYQGSPSLAVGVGELRSFMLLGYLHFQKEGWNQRQPWDLSGIEWVCVSKVAEVKCFLVLRTF